MVLLLPRLRDPIFAPPMSEAIDGERAIQDSRDAIDVITSRMLARNGFSIYFPRSCREPMLGRCSIKDYIASIY